MRTDRRRSIAVLAAALLLVGGCTGTPTGPEDQPTPATTGRAAATTPPPPPTPAAAVSALQPSFDELEAAVPARIGIAIAPVGKDTVASFGSWSTDVAWSTIKVPLAIAALRADHAVAQPLVVKAITQSDNAAAEQLWSQLGSPDQAAQQVQTILRQGGDPTTIVESRRLRPPFTAFGQTQWALGLQAQFAAHLPCIADAGTVVDLMHKLVSGQRWGLARDGSAAKGGWGPGQASGYLVRQFGIVSTETGQLGVALAADAATFDAGVDALNQMAGWLIQRKSELPSGRC